MTVVRIINRTDTAANWTAQNPIPYAGEVCSEYNTGKIKVGDGVTAWNSLGYSGGGGGGGAVDSVNGKTGTVVLVPSDIGAQPVDSDLTAIAALSTTTFGRALLTLADAAAGRTSLGLGTAATQPTAAFDAAGLAAAAQAASQPLDSDLTAIAALTTTTFGRSLLTLADAAAGRTSLGLGTIATQAASAVAITGGAIAGITDLAVGDGGTGASDAATARTNLGLAIGSNVQAYDSDLAALAALSFSQGDIIHHNGTALVRLAAGTSGWYLKTQGAGANPVWAAVAGGGGVATDAIFDAKGDLPVGTGADTAAKLSVGVAGSMVVPDSTASTGLRWAPFMAPVPSGKYVFPWTASGNAGKISNLNELVFTPVVIPNAFTADRISVWVNTAGGAGAVVRLGIYTASPTTALPHTLVLDAGTIVADGSTGLKEITISQAVTPGLMWLACVSQTATCTLKFGPGTGGFYHWNNDGTGLQTPGSNRWRESSVTGALPSTATPTLGTNDFSFFYMWLRAS